MPFLHFEAKPMWRKASLAQGVPMQGDLGVMRHLPFDNFAGTFKFSDNFAGMQTFSDLLSPFAGMLLISDS